MHNHKTFCLIKTKNFTNEDKGENLVFIYVP